jgi:hypothetical protein
LKRRHGKTPAELSVHDPKHRTEKAKWKLKIEKCKLKIGNRGALCSLLELVFPTQPRTLLARHERQSWPYGTDAANKSICNLHSSIFNPQFSQRSAARRGSVPGISNP